MAPIRNPWRAMVLVSALMLAACGPAESEPASEQADLLTETTNETAAAAASDGATAEATQAQSALVTSGLHQLVAMSAPPAEDGTLGSGCSDEELEELPDGDWYAFVLDYDRSTVTVDVACVYGRDTDQFEAYAAAEDAGESTALTNHVVINDVVHERTLRIASDAEAYLASAQWEPITAAGFARASSQADGTDNRGVWLRVENGRVSAVVQPYVSGVASG